MKASVKASAERLERCEVRFEEITYNVDASQRMRIVERNRYCVSWGRERFLATKISLTDGNVPRQRFDYWTTGGELFFGQIDLKASPRAFGAASLVKYALSDKEVSEWLMWTGTYFSSFGVVVPSRPSALRVSPSVGPLLVQLAESDYEIHVNRTTRQIRITMRAKGTEWNPTLVWAGFMSTKVPSVVALFMEPSLAFAITERIELDKSGNVSSRSTSSGWFQHNDATYWPRETTLWRPSIAGAEPSSRPGQRVSSTLVGIAEAHAIPSAPSQYWSAGAWITEKNSEGKDAMFTVPASESQFSDAALEALTKSGRSYIHLWVIFAMGVFISIVSLHYAR